MPVEHKLFIINVGANASHGALRSPILPNGHFVFVPIPDHQAFHRLPQYRELVDPNGPALKDYMPKRFWPLRAHNDPEFYTWTYGDYPTHSPRAANLKHLELGDTLFFLARLTEWREDQFTNESAFYLIGFFAVEHIFKDVNHKPPPQTLKQIQNNAHVLRGLSDPALWDDFWVFKGSATESRLFKTPVRFDRPFATKTLKSANGKPWQWKRNTTELQTIGSYTRSCRMISDPAQISKFWKLVGTHP